VIPSLILGNLDEKRVEAKIDWAVRLQGAEDVRVLLARPKQADWGLRPADNASLSPGDTIIVYLAASFERYWAESFRTFVAEKSSFVEVNDEKANGLYQQTMVDVKPGKSVCQFYQETIDQFRQKNVQYIPDYGLGHGIGLSQEELPVLDDKDVTRFAEGMCFALRIAIRDQARGAVMMGNTLYLSEKGAEVLTT
jgi:Xaa-Pro aminopeptidase